MTAFDNSSPRDRSKVDVEFERDFADVFDEEVLGDGLVIGNFAEIELVSGELERDETGVSRDGDIVVRTSP